MTNELEITCPSCGEIIHLDETLAGPTISRIRAEANQVIKKALDAADAKVAEASEREANLAEKERLLAERESSVQTQVNRAIASERQKIASLEREKLVKELSPELEAERARAKQLEDKLATTQAAELKLRGEREQVEQRGKEIKLEIARQVDAQRASIREEASKDQAETYRLTLAEKERRIEAISRKLDEAQRKTTQGSQENQGEVLEDEFEITLRGIFPQDTIEPVKKGVRGGDIHQRILGNMGRPVGTIFWEIKRAQSWDERWISKAKADAAEAKVDVLAIVSNDLPKNVSGFGFHEGVWCTALIHAMPLAVALRCGVIAAAEARQGTIGRETKKDRLYDYMIGPEFRATVEGIALPFRELSDELAAEKRATLARWKRQEKRIERVLMSVASLQGDLQGIAGGEMVQLPGFELDAGAYEIAASSESN